MRDLILSFQSNTKRWLSFARSRDSLANADIIIISSVILCIWLTGIIFTSTTHEFWRDEVRALSLARDAASPIDLFSLLKNEGHPILWYLLLYIGKSIINTPLILQVTSIIVAFFAVMVFMFFSPFPLWLKTFFIFSVLPFYKYSVFARNYGISMLFLFVFAALYPKRNKYPLLLALVLFFLANTNVHSAILVCLVAFFWFWDIVVEKNTLSVKSQWMSFYVPFVIVFLGIMLCLFTAYPTDKTIVTHLHSLGLTGVAKALIKAIVSPAHMFKAIIPNIHGPADQVLFYIAIFGLIPRINLFLAAFGGQVALSMFFDLIYKGSLRHQGLFLVFLISLYWIALETHHLHVTKRANNMLFKAGLYLSLLIMILFGLYEAKVYVLRDIRWELSSSKELGEFINESGIYRDAIIVPEPSYLVESLPYYVNNEIYLPREHRFGKTVSFTTDANTRLSLRDLLAIANEIKKKYDRPVLIVLGHLDLDKSKSNTKWFSFNKIFSWNAKDLIELSRTTKLVGKFKSALNDENYMVYAID